MITPPLVCVSLILRALHIDEDAHAEQKSALRYCIFMTRDD
jgi:hypothetical protein